MRRLKKSITNAAIIPQVFLFAVFSLAFISCDSKGADAARQKAPQNVKSYPFSIITRTGGSTFERFPAVVEGIKDVQIQAQVGGKILKVLTEEGADVRQGQALFEIEAPAAAQELASANASFETAKLNVERMQPLFEKGIISQNRMQNLQNSLDIAQANLSKAQKSIEWTRVYSPITGKVGPIHFREGSVINTSMVLTHVADTREVIANFSMNEKDLIPFLNQVEGNQMAQKIKNLPPLQFEMADGTLLSNPGKIISIAGTVSSNGAVRIRAQFENSQQELRSGSTGRVVIEEKIPDAIIIPQKSSYRLQDKIMVYLYKAGKAETHSVEAIESSDGKNLLVRSGLQPNDTLIVDGLASLRHGAEIQLEN